ncbi:hypothetical protein DFP72DRAFT_855382 [Ephemerocybe angulata]|uniref:Uncharacterized protein n=1 Tax=Ephemerocybe angulata TaxID=980116 RepID=A0A8H6HHP5_9AGAR|nr:hypothetical protein DFP72DRAFT_857499 [Tulosesus angulatus]KAF6746512.1 hypothetical protein DFP72DRAFT_855382 [Tulosesus angulatus]
MVSRRELQQESERRRTFFRQLDTLRGAAVHIHPGTDFSSLRRSTHAFVLPEEETFVPRTLSPRFVPLDNYPVHDVEQIYILHVGFSGESYRIVTRQQPPHRPHRELWHRTPSDTASNSTAETTSDTASNSTAATESETDSDSTIHTNGSQFTE